MGSFVFSGGEVAKLRAHGYVLGLSYFLWLQQRGREDTEGVLATASILPNAKFKDFLFESPGRGNYLC